MASKLAKRDARKKWMSELGLTRAQNDCDAIRARHSSKLLEDLRRSYRALSFEQRKQVTAFISELSGAVTKHIGERRRSAYLTSAFLER